MELYFGDLQADVYLSKYKIFIRIQPSRPQPNKN